MGAGELASLDVGDVFHRGVIRREFRLGTGGTKYCRARTIYLESSKAIAAVLAYLRQRDQSLSFTGTEPLFVGCRQNRREQSFRLSANTVVQTFARMYERDSYLNSYLNGLTADEVIWDKPPRGIYVHA